MPDNDPTTLYHLIMTPRQGSRVTIAFESADDRSAQNYAADWIGKERIPSGAKVCLGRPGGERIVLVSPDLGQAIPR